MAESRNPNIKKYAFQKGNKIAAKGKGKLKRKTALKNLVQKAIEENRSFGIKSIEDFDQILFQKILAGLRKGKVRDAAFIALKLVEFRYAKKKEHDIGENTQRILEIHRPVKELLENSKS